MRKQSNTDKYHCPVCVRNGDQFTTLLSKGHGSFKCPQCHKSFVMQKRQGFGQTSLITIIDRNQKLTKTIEKVREAVRLELGENDLHNALEDLEILLYITGILRMNTREQADNCKKIKDIIAKVMTRAYQDDNSSIISMEEVNQILSSFFIASIMNKYKFLYNPDELRNILNDDSSRYFRFSRGHGDTSKKLPVNPANLIVKLAKGNKPKVVKVNFDSTKKLIN